MKTRWLAIYTLLLFLLKCSAVDAWSADQQNSATAQTSGTIKDGAGATLPKVTITFKAKHFKREIVASQDGHYEVDLPFGTYSVIARLQGCRDFHLKTWTVQADKRNTLNITMKCRSTPIF
jgi:hypothetical protein